MTQLTSDRRVWTRHVLLIVGVVMAMLSQMPMGWAHSEEAGIALKTYTGIEVDGKLDDWVRRLKRDDWTGKMQVQKGEVFELIRAVPIYVNTLTSRVESGAIASPQDFSAVVYTLWDATNVYLAAKVTDDQVVTQHDGADIWQDDAIEVWFDCRHDAMTQTLFQDDEYQLGVSPASRYRSSTVGWAWRNPNAEGVIQKMKAASTLTSDGYVIEASVPWSVLQGCHPEIGAMIGFNLTAVDKDEDQLWSHITWSGRLHSDPSQFGHLYFMDAPINLFPSDVFETPAELLQP